MGSSPSTSRQPTPPPHRRSTAPPTSRSVGFREVHFQTPEGASGTQRGSSSTHRSNSHASTQSPKKTVKMSGQQRPHGHQDQNGFSDLAAVAGQMMREKTMFSENDQPKYQNEDDMALESFYHQSGTTYSCLYQGGQRYYLDSFNTQDWHPFPKEWYKQGVLVTDRVIEESTPSQPSQQRSGPSSSSSSSRGSHQQDRASQYAPADDREGFIDHPTKGRLQTYVFEEKKNVQYYYDKESGGWVRLPIAWELHSDMVKRLVVVIEEALPDWTDKHDLLAALRASSYDVSDCISTYLTIGDQSGLAMPKNTKDAELLEEKEKSIKELTKEVEKLKAKVKNQRKALDVEKNDRKSAEDQVQHLRDCISSLEVTAATATAQLEAVQRERPKTARPPSARRPKTPIQPPEPENQVEPETVVALNQAMKRLHKDHIKLKMEAGQRFEDLRAIMKQLAVGLTKIRLCDTDQSREVIELRELYRREALQRKLLYNKLQELRGNIRVFCRCRYDNRTRCCLQFPTEREVLPPGGKKGLKFDRVFTPNSTQEEVFEEARPVIASCVDGYNVSILAYGQTGSGKTFTMQGPTDNPGVNVRALKELLQICEEKENITYKMTASMVEIYNEAIRDLLTKDVQVLDIRANGNKILLPGMKEMEVSSLEDIEEIIHLGGKNRSTASTKMNSHSSRSHLIFMIKVEGRDKSSGAVSTGTLTLCDLAGSERVGKTEATGQRLVEAAAINKSLSSLGQVFTALKTGQLHVPYRNSKLTHILQPSLSGDAKACLFVAVSPDESNVQETVSSLQFGSSARQVALGQAKQNIRKAPPVDDF